MNEGTRDFTAPSSLKRSHFSLLLLKHLTMFILLPLPLQPN